MCSAPLESARRVAGRHTLRRPGANGAHPRVLHEIFSQADITADPARHIGIERTDGGSVTTRSCSESVPPTSLLTHQQDKPTKISVAGCSSASRQSLDVNGAREGAPHTNHDARASGSSRLGDGTGNGCCCWNRRRNSGTRVVIVDTDGRVVASATSEHAPFASPRTTWAEQDPEDW